MVPSGDNALVYAIIGIATFLILIFFLVFMALFLDDFSRELKYLNTEIRRTSGKERKYWKKRKRRLWWSLLPFVKY